jgi:hypothetical protein
MVRAADVTFVGGLGTLSASATFGASGTDLLVILTNSSGSDVLHPRDVLTAIYFDIEGSLLSLARDSAIIGPTSAVLFGTTDPGGVVGGEWEYLSNASVTTPLGQNYVISSSGLDLAGNGGLFPGSNLQGPVSVDGIQYGITSEGDDPDTGNAAVKGKNALVKNQVVFKLSGLPAGFDPSTSVRNVQFQYGTTSCSKKGTGKDVCVTGIPEPGTLSMLALSIFFITRRRVR